MSNNIDFANIVWNPKNFTPVVINSKSPCNLPPASYIFVAAAGSEGDIMTEMDPMTLVNMIKPKYYVTDEENAELFEFCRQISVEPILVKTKMQKVIRKLPVDSVFSNLKDE